MCDSVEYDWQVAYYTALADAVVSFILGLPSFLILLHQLWTKRAISFSGEVVAEWNKP